jgi:2-(1,2-epoxy-1,2-dihydrophenyl)acetyl-CoA isomerase
MQITDLKYEKSDAIAWVRIDRPERRNALGGTTTRQIAQVCQDAAHDPAVRVLVVTGVGDAFCAGGDMQDTFERGRDMSAQQWSDRIRNGPNVLARLLQTLDKPVIAAVNGVAVGGGTTIALACDLRIASDQARFCLPFARIGITPEFGCSYLLQRVVGLGRAMELLLLGEFIGAETAERYGLVNRVVAHQDLPQATLQMARHLAALPAEALARIKQLQRFAQSNGLDATLEQEALSLGQCFTSEEHRAAVARFLSRKPR